MKNVWIDFLICYFLGVFGVHKFREKKIGWGILYIFTGGLFGFGWLYDTIKYLVVAIKTTFKGPTSFEYKMPSQINPQISKIIKITLIVFVAVFLLAIFSASCSMLFTCKHQYTSATCIQQQICTKCGQTKGEPLGHSWTEATCTAPKTCTICALTEGKPAEHSWTKATCTAPKTCTTCKLTEGEPAEHSWTKATCTAPKTCTTCKLTKGKPTDHTWNKATCQTPKTCDTCGKTEGTTTSHNYTDGKCFYCGKASPASSSDGSPSDNHSSDNDTSSGNSSSSDSSSSSDNSSFSDDGSSSTYEENSTMVWIPTKGGKKYHSHSGCSNMDNPQYVTISEAQSQGFTACKRCH